MTLTIVTNNQPRDLKAWYELPADVFEVDFRYILNGLTGLPALPAEANEGEYISIWGEWYKTEEIDSSPRFIHYRGTWYDIHDMQAITVESQYGRIGWQMDVKKDSPFAVWQLISPDSYFSGTVFRYAEDDYGTDYDKVICGTYYS